MDYHFLDITKIHVAGFELWSKKSFAWLGSVCDIMYSKLFKT